MKTSTSAKTLQTPETRIVLHGTRRKLLSIAIVSSYTLASALILTPGQRGLLVLIVQSGYFVGSLAVAGRERALQTGAIKLKPLTTLGKIFLLGPICFSIASTFISDNFFVILLSLPASILSVVVPRLINSAFLYERNVSRYFKSDLVTAAGLFPLLILFLWLRIDDYRVWANCFILASLIPACLFWFDFVPPERSRTMHERVIARFAMGEIAISIAQRFDRVYMGTLGQTSMLGRYTFAASLTELSVLPLQIMAQLSSRPDSTDQASKRTRILLWGGSICGLFASVVFSPLVLRRTVGSEYVSSLALRIVLAIGALMIGAQRFASAHLLRNSEIRLAVFSDLTTGVICFFSYLILIPKFNALGASIGVCVGYLVGLSVAVVAIHRNR